MANVFENPESPLLKGEARSEKEAEIFDKKQELLQIEEQIKGALKEVANADKRFAEAEFSLKSAQNDLEQLRSKDDRLSEEIGELENESTKPEIKKPEFQENAAPSSGMLMDHPIDRNPYEQ